MPISPSSRLRSSSITSAAVLALGLPLGPVMMGAGTQPSSTAPAAERQPAKERSPGQPATFDGAGKDAGMDGAKDPGAVELPASASPVPELAPFAFMTGRWVGVTPNKLVNEETWSPARGNHMTALFRQVRRDGKPALIEVSLISAEADGVKLRLRHLHTNLEVPENRKEVSVFTLRKAEENRVEFGGTGKAEEVTAVIYRLTAPDAMEMEIQFAPDSKEKGFVTKYRRETK